MSQRDSARPIHNVDDYLEAIYEIAEEGGRVQQARIAQRLGVTRASVSEQIQRMVKRGLVAVEGRSVSLTKRGFAIAEDAVRRHRTAERFLLDVLKMPWSQVHEVAEEFQVGITPEVEERMIAMLDGPATCPHGNPIPGTGAPMPTDCVRLNEVGESTTVTLVRLTEDVELDGKAMRYFEESGLMPGARIEIEGTSPDGTVALRVGRRRSTLGPTLADNLWVRPASSREAAVQRTGAARPRAASSRR